MKPAKLAMALVAFGILGGFGCGRDSDDDDTPKHSISVFNGENNRLNAYDADSLTKQTVIPRNDEAPPAGRDINGQICFRRDASGLHMIAGEDTNQGAAHVTAGWGYFKIRGTYAGKFQYEEIGKLIPTYQPTPDDAENYGCGFLSDGRLLTTDLGNQADGDPNGQLIIWFPPFDTGAELTNGGVLPTNPAHYCKLDIAIGTAGGIYVDEQDRVYVASARGEVGIYRFTGPFPTSNTAAGGCGRVDGTGAPMADVVHKERFIGPDEYLFTPNAIAPSGHGTFYVSSVFNGVIAEYDANGQIVRPILQPPEGSSLPPYPTGTPLGIGVDSSGTLYYADIGIVVGSGGIGPGPNNGTVRRIRFINGQPQPPETLDSGLDFPDGIGVLEN